MLSSMFSFTLNLNTPLVFMLKFLISFLSVQILIARGASLTAENVNGYALQVPVTSNISYDFILV